MFNRLRNRLLLLNMCIISIVMIGAFAVIYLTTSNNIHTENQNKLDLLSSKPNAAYLNLPDATTREKIVIGIAPSESSLSFNMIVNSHGDIVKVISHIDMPEEAYFKAAELVRSGKKESSMISLDEKRWQYQISPMNGTLVSHDNGKSFVINGNGEHYQITFLNVTESYNTLMELLTTLFIVGLIMLFVIFAISLFFANRSIAPIAETWEKQKQFFADVSHELKTPLAIINANSDALLANEGDTIQSQRKWLDYIKNQTDRMSQLVNDLLYLAKTEDTNLTLNVIPFDISEMVSDVILSMEAVAFEKEITLLQEVEPNLIIKSDCEKVKQVITILVDNAIKYTEEKGRIHITLKKTRHQLAFSIKNSGKGIAKKHLSKVFDRFYRADPARTQENGGYGLGLPIAKAIIDRLGGTIHAGSEENDGATFTFTLGL
ncbi:sensor histidine kinase [Paenibacillus apiarius]|uniref:histidine kinase n=2 Tax=Paenibacillus apiarius TaxID=46240 RepID=A0ABT4E4G0_9BACL|nr:HAMP domain-containing sensor histidine kinase [Paenibacillus apiarius]MCY9517064.1 HAMP domain-containing histidine kinase [Paenibacillus apiarius]MCY9523228.1 HAMP domain-containing histidine kinase [Paenibacillus apiarius]MCY9560885.1 HAMP domain-containing histidine kinase [Paenibacillus apiarius]MCY9682806.1 HAMP domain-containing histidine kinase [Paenibacillus apiarius]MCY9721185.1 HAMP domain-containing histidine kinase [Paenibacillus apiarius]